MKERVNNRTFIAVCNIKKKSPTFSPVAVPSHISRLYIFHRSPFIFDKRLSQVTPRDKNEI